MRTLYFCPVVSSSVFLLFFLAYYQQSEIRCLPYFYTCCGLSANLECRSEMCCMRLAGNTGLENDAKNRCLGTIAELCPAESSQLRHLSTIGKKLVKQHYLLHMFPQYGKLWLRSVLEFGAPQQLSTAFASWQHDCMPL